MWLMGSGHGFPQPHWPTVSQVLQASVSPSLKKTKGGCKCCALAAVKIRSFEHVRWCLRPCKVMDFLLHLLGPPLQSVAPRDCCMRQPRSHPASTGLGNTGSLGQGSTVLLGGMRIISLQRFFTFLPQLLAFFVMRSSESKQHVRILWLCKCQKLFILHLPALHRLSGASVHFVKTFPALFWLLQNTRQIIKDSK